MLRILTQLKKELCSACSVGDPPKILGYKASGSCMDYIYEKLKVPFSMAWEIYTNEKVFQELSNYINRYRPLNAHSIKNNSSSTDTNANVPNRGITNLMTTFMLYLVLLAYNIA